MPSLALAELLCVGTLCGVGPGSADLLLPGAVKGGPNNVFSEVGFGLGGLGVPAGSGVGAWGHLDANVNRGRSHRGKLVIYSWCPANRDEETWAEGELLGKHFLPDFTVLD